MGKPKKGSGKKTSKDLTVKNATAVKGGLITVRKAGEKPVEY
jgi:hypothetical protein